MIRKTLITITTVRVECSNKLTVYVLGETTDLFFAKHSWRGEPR